MEFKQEGLDLVETDLTNHEEKTLTVNEIALFDDVELNKHIRRNIIGAWYNGMNFDYNFFVSSLVHLGKLRVECRNNGDKLNEHLVLIYCRFFEYLYSITKPALESQRPYIDKDFNTFIEYENKYSELVRIDLRNTFSLMYNLLGDEEKGKEVSGSISIPENDDIDTFNAIVKSTLNPLFYKLTFNFVKIIETFSDITITGILNGIHTFNSDKMTDIQYNLNMIHDIILPHTNEVFSIIDKYMRDTHVDVRHTVASQLIVVQKFGDFHDVPLSKEIKNIIIGLIDTVHNYESYGVYCRLKGKCKECLIKNILDVRIVMSLLLLYCYKSYYHIRATTGIIIDGQESKFYEEILPEVLKLLEPYLGGNKSLLNPSILEHKYLQSLFKSLNNSPDSLEKSDIVYNLINLYKENNEDKIKKFLNKFILNIDTLQPGNIEFYLISIFFNKYKYLISFENKRRHFERLVNLIDIFYSTGHNQRVGRNSKWIGGVLKNSSHRLSQKQRETIMSTDLDLLEKVATLHDIGKIKTDWMVLSKVGKLNNDEYLHAQLHVKYGLEMKEEFFSNESEDIQNMMEKVISHHENYDGSGYSEGLSGDDIDIIKSTVRIADVIDAMGEKRNYDDRPITVTDIKNELIKNKGKLFDPVIIDILVDNGLDDFLVKNYPKRVPANNDTNQKVA